MDRLEFVDIVERPGLVEQYVELRNSWNDLLLSRPVTVAGTREWLAAARAVVVCAVSGDLVAGAAVLYPARGNEVAVFVRERGRGVGSALLERVEETARERGADSLWAWVLTGNDIARRVFEKAGFRETAESTRVFEGEPKRGVTYRKRLGGKEDSK